MRPDRTQYLVEHGMRFEQYMSIVETQDTKSEGGKRVSSIFVIRLRFRIMVLRTVDLDN